MEIKKISFIIFVFFTFMFCFNLVNAFNDTFCQYNSFENSTITTCNNFYSIYDCSKLFDKGISSPNEWTTQVTYPIPPNSVLAIAEIGNPILFNQIDVGNRFYYYNNMPNRFEISVYDENSNLWYDVVTELNYTIKEKYNNTIFGGGGGSGAIGIYYNDFWLNLKVSKIMVYVEGIANTSGDKNVIFGEVALCVKNETSPVYAGSSIFNETAGNYSLNSPCETDSDCIGYLKCEYGFCSLVGTGAYCSNDDECISGNCFNGKCTKANLWDSLETSKNQQFGDSANTNNFISLFFIIGISAFLMFYGNVIAGVFCLFVLSIFFVIIGWLSPFILIGMIVTGLIGVVFKIMIGSSSE